MTSEGSDTRALVVDTREALAEALWAADLENGGFKGRLFREDCDWIVNVFLESGLLTTADAYREQIARVRLRFLQRRPLWHLPLLPLRARHPRGGTTHRRSRSVARPRREGQR